MTTWLDIITWLPLLVILALLWTFYAAIRYTRCLLRQRRGDKLKDAPYDYEVIAHAIWKERGYAAWQKSWQEEQERER